MERFDAKLLLSGLKTKNILFVEHWCGKASGDCGGKFYAFTELQGLLDITYPLLSFMELEGFKVQNSRTGNGTTCIRVKNPVSFIRDVSQELCGKWDKFNVAVLDIDNVF